MTFVISHRELKLDVFTNIAILPHKEFDSQWILVSPKFLMQRVSYILDSLHLCEILSEFYSWAWYRHHLLSAKRLVKETWLVLLRVLGRAWVTTWGLFCYICGIGQKSSVQIDITLTSVVIHSKIIGTIWASLKLSLEVFAGNLILSFEGLILDAKELNHLRGPKQLVIGHLVAEPFQIFDKRNHLIRVLASCWPTLVRYLYLSVDWHLSRILETRDLHIA